jgi:hypothetical protein
VKQEPRLPVLEQVDETKAAAEDRLAQAVVPRLESVFGMMAATMEMARERLGQLRRRA